MGWHNLESLKTRTLVQPFLGPTTAHCTRTRAHVWVLAGYWASPTVCKIKPKEALDLQYTKNPFGLWLCQYRSKSIFLPTQKNLKQILQVCVAIFQGHPSWPIEFELMNILWLRGSSWAKLGQSFSVFSRFSGSLTWRFQHEASLISLSGKNATNDE